MTSRMVKAPIVIPAIISGRSQSLFYDWVHLVTGRYDERSIMNLAKLIVDYFY